MEKKINKMCNTSLIISMAFIVVGLFLFIKPDTTISVISYVIGGALLVSGIFSVYKYFTAEGIGSIFNFDLVYGVLLVIAGMFLVIKPTALATLFPIILGIWIIINSVTKFQYALVLKRVKNDDWVYTALVSLLTLIWGVVLLWNPFASALAITQIIGIFIIVYAVLDIIDNFIIRKNIKDILDVFK
ncbi:MAG: DUF308 domain-containing protein [Bacilli bacterium]|nr:DUF308 domain-containing protein [Bacilli bacterium]